MARPASPLTDKDVALLNHLQYSQSLGEDFGYGTHQTDTTSPESHAASTEGFGPSLDSKAEYAEADLRPTVTHVRPQVFHYTMRAGATKEDVEADVSAFAEYLEMAVKDARLPIPVTGKIGFYKGHNTLTRDGASPCTHEQLEAAIKAQELLSMKDGSEINYTMEAKSEEA